MRPLNKIPDENPELVEWECRHMRDGLRIGVERLLDRHDLTLGERALVHWARKMIEVYLDDSEMKYSDIHDELSDCFFAATADKLKANEE